MRLKQKNLLTINGHVQGIPCLVRVTHYHHQKGMPASIAPSDVDHYGYTNIEFDVLDRNGRPAPWLEAKLKDEDIERIEADVFEWMETCMDEED